MTYRILNFNDEVVKELNSDEELELFQQTCIEEHLHCFYWDTDMKERLVNAGVEEDHIRFIHKVEEENEL